MCRVQREKTWHSGRRGCILWPCQGQNGNPGSDVIGLDKADLDKADLQAAAESRLRSARLYIGSMLAVIRGEANLRAGLKLKDFSRLGLLSVDVFVVGPEFSMSIEFSKILTDEFQNSSYATTWDWTTNRLHGGDASYIVSNLSQQPGPLPGRVPARQRTGLRLKYRHSTRGACTSPARALGCPNCQNLPIEAEKALAGSRQRRFWTRGKP